MYRPKVKDYAGQPIVLQSPTGKEPFDAIEPVELPVSYTPAPGAFQVLVTIPLKLIHWTPRPGEPIKLDLGYIFGNAAGNTVSVRSYWSNDGFASGVTNDVPNESRLEPNEWGTAQVE